MLRVLLRKLELKVVLPIRISRFLKNLLVTSLAGYRYDFSIEGKRRQTILKIMCHVERR